MPLIVEGAVARTPHGAPGSWSGYWKEAAQPYAVDLCRRRTHHRSFFNIEAGKPGATDAMPVDARRLHSVDGFALTHPHEATRQRCDGQKMFFQSSEARRAVDFDVARELARLIDAASADAPIDFRITCASDPLIADCSKEPRRFFAELDIAQLSAIDYPMAYRTISEDRQANGRTTRIRQATGPKDGEWQSPTFRLASADRERQIWVVTLGENTAGKTEITMRSDFVIH
ncbi:hypothetical protein [Sphingomonas sp. AX6]|uniref:hypothetical protein n=1 Tax=Sphingomonas sp. AX6 TaxID=2653171 RepID=UPI001F1F47E8|nr:hypothetical protein [Sphingomonas sp. AX6]